MIDPIVIDGGLHGELKEFWQAILFFKKKMPCLKSEQVFTQKIEDISTGVGQFLE
jgi:hypothetical protein